MQKVTLQEIYEMAKEAQGQINHIYLHWSAGHYGQFFDDYHINIDADGSIYISTDDLTERRSHTWRRNSNAIGIAMACCAFATTNDLGSEPPTQEQIESLAQVVAVLCMGLGININDVMTHAEAANEDEYGPDQTWERWDLWFLQNGDEWGSGGDILRGKSNFYRDYFIRNNMFQD